MQWRRAASADDSRLTRAAYTQSTSEQALFEDAEYHAQIEGGIYDRRNIVPGDPPGKTLQAPSSGSR